MIQQAEQIAADLTAAGIKAYTDPAKAETNRPCVLVPPPVIDLTTRAATWTLAVLSSHQLGTLAAWREMDPLLAELVAALPIERTEPATYALTAAKVYPAFLATLTTSH